MKWTLIVNCSTSRTLQKSTFDFIHTLYIKHKPLCMVALWAKRRFHAVMALHTFFWKWKTHLSTIMVQWRSLFWYAHNSTSQKAIYCHSSPTLWMIACNSQRVEFISLSDINGLNWIYLFKRSGLSFSDRWFCWKKK